MSNSVLRVSPFTVYFLITTLGVVLYYWHGAGFDVSGFLIGVVMSLTVALFMILAIAFWKDSYVDS